MMTRITNILATLEGVSDWKINEERKQSYELFLVRDKLETARATDTRTVRVTVYVRADGTIGEASVQLYATQTDGEIADKLSAAVRNARLVRNADYELCAEGEFRGEQTTNLATLAPSEATAMFANAALKADGYRDGSINALEVFVTRTEQRVVNSRGTDKTQVGYGAMVEAIPTWGTGEASVELYEQYNVTAFDEWDTYEEINGRMLEARDRSLAVKPDFAIDCDVVFGEKELSSLWSDLVGELNMQAVYAHSNAFAKGDRVQSDAATGDRLTMTVRGAVEGSRASAYFDQDGTQLVDRTVIKDGVVTDYYGTARFAQYLGLVPTGAVGCIEVASGTMADGAVREGTYLECMSLSGLQVDVYNDYIGGEVRLAYYCDGTHRIPVTGISFAGKLSTVLDGMRLTARRATYENCLGPVFARCKGLTVL